MLIFVCLLGLGGVGAEEREAIYSYYLMVMLDIHASNIIFFSCAMPITGLVVSMCLGGAFIGSTLSGWIADGVGRRRAFQLCALPMIIGASIR